MVWFFMSGVLNDRAALLTIFCLKLLFHCVINDLGVDLEQQARAFADQFLKRLLTYLIRVRFFYLDLHVFVKMHFSISFAFTLLRPSKY